MRTFRAATRLGLAVGLLLLGSLSAGAADRMSAAAIKSLFPGTFAVSVSGVSATLVAGSGGALTGRSFAGTDTGQWSVRGGQLCIMLREWFDGRTRCSTVAEDNGNWYRAGTVRFRRL